MGGTLLESARSMDDVETNIQRKPNVLFIAVDDMNDFLGNLFANAIELVRST